jgi:hypothetical protein
MFKLVNMGVLSLGLTFFVNKCTLLIFFLKMIIFIFYMYKNQFLCSLSLELGNQMFMYIPSSEKLINLCSALILDFLFV